MNFYHKPKASAWRPRMLAGTAVYVAASLLALAHLDVHAEAVKQANKTHKSVKQSRVDITGQANQMGAGIRAAQMALSPGELAIAQHVQVGRIPCELGAFVTVEADLHAPGYFDISGKKFKFRMVPVLSSTGAIRLEDTTAGAVWLQLANKSMLMNHKTGSRMADVCMTPTQVVVADAMLKNPPRRLLQPSAVALTPAPQLTALEPLAPGMVR